MMETLHGYELAETIATGGMGTLYKARRENDTAGQIWYCVRAIPLKGETLDEGIRTLSDWLNSHQRLQHSGIHCVQTLFCEGTTVYLVSDYLEGASLGHWLRDRNGREMPRAKALKIIQEVGDALRYAHQQGIVHGDLKPSSIFINDSGEVITQDFGLHQTLRTMRHLLESVPSMEIGSFSALSLDYASPELLGSCKPDPRDDLYSLACLSYELLTGHHPFDRMRASSALLAGRRVMPRQGLNTRQLAILARGLDFDRDERPYSIDTFLSEFQRGSRNSTVLPWSLRGGQSALVMSLFILVLGFAGFQFFPDIHPLLNIDAAQSTHVSQDASIHEAEKEPRPTAPPGKTPSLLAQAELPDAVVRSVAAIAPSAAAPATQLPMAEEPLPETDAGASADRLDELLLRAERQLKRQRLSSPEGDNALETFRRVLELEPGNAAALTGMAEITSKYTLWAEAAVRNRDWLAAKNNLEKAVAINPEDELLLDTLEQVKLTILLENKRQGTAPDHASEDLISSSGSGENAGKPLP